MQGEANKVKKKAIHVAAFGSKSRWFIHQWMCGLISWLFICKNDTIKHQAEATFHFQERVNPAVCQGRLKGAGAPEDVDQIANFAS